MTSYGLLRYCGHMIHRHTQRKSLINAEFFFFNKAFYVKKKRKKRKEIKGKEREGRKGKETEGKETEGKGREGKEKKKNNCSFQKVVTTKLLSVQRSHLEVMFPELFVFLHISITIQCSPGLVYFFILLLLRDPLLYLFDSCIF